MAKMTSCTSPFRSNDHFHGNLNRGVHKCAEKQPEAWLNTESAYMYSCMHKCKICGHVDKSTYMYMYIYSTCTCIQPLQFVLSGQEIIMYM